MLHLPEQQAIKIKWIHRFIHILAIRIAFTQACNIKKTLYSFSTFRSFFSNNHKDSITPTSNTINVIMIFEQYSYSIHLE